MLSPRGHPVVVSINESEIVIMGGMDNGGCLSDILVFNVGNNECRKVADAGGDFKFWSRINQAALVKNKVVALVEKDICYTLIEWTLG